MKRMMLALAGAFIAVLLMANIATAHLIDGSIDRGRLESPEVVMVQGTIQCTEGEVYRIRLTLEQGHSQGFGQTRGECTGDVQTWRVRVFLQSGPGFQEGPAEACANVTSRQPGTTHRDQVRTCEVIQIVS